MSGQERAAIRHADPDDARGNAVVKDTAPLARPEVMTAQDRDRLRRYIAANVVGDNPPPLTAEAQDLIRAMLGSDYAGGTT